MKLGRPSVIQSVHGLNAVLGIVLCGCLIGTATNIQSFVSEGSAIAGFGNYNVFAYPATFVYMLIPAVTATVYSFILMCDRSSGYEAWRPSRTMVSSIACFAGAVLLAAVFPLIPGADIITQPYSSVECSWRDYMVWETIYNNPDVFPWVLDMGKACTCFRASVAFCWLVAVGWIAQTILYWRIAKRPLPASLDFKNTWRMSTVNRLSKPSPDQEPYPLPSYLVTGEKHEMSTY
ncbi:uncharacterized protein BYT42DRAFT_618897 [Radiomyces spectabilis]|uniref:uncharacterized protein n=1 Tax=Radiomyces spectabilis TaxID=64574 RepID=UPI00221EEAB5|nr:uncharacterized protein BYT42DRAFT_618897 [Radiomyces spectabilis]KAI8364752.1 hypothetical protein BYT42DRAFT_618897 [Radiomyces spectabilis]